MKSESERIYEEGSAGTDKKRKNDPLQEFSEQEAMTPAKIKSHEPTAVRRNPDQKIVKKGEEGTDTERAQKQYQKRGMTKID